jgi:hypothetical protein
MSAYVSIRQHTSAHCLRRCCLRRCPSWLLSSAYFSIRQHMAAYGSIRQLACSDVPPGYSRQHTSAYVSIRQLACGGVPPGYSTDPLRAVVARGHGAELPAFSPSAYVSIRQHTSAYVSIRQHTSAYVSRVDGAELPAR